MCIKIVGLTQYASALIGLYKYKELHIGMTQYAYCKGQIVQRRDSKVMHPYFSHLLFVSFINQVGHGII